MGHKREREGIYNMWLITKTCTCIHVPYTRLVMDALIIVHHLLSGCARNCFRCEATMFLSSGISRSHDDRFLAVPVASDTAACQYSDI